MKTIKIFLASSITQFGIERFELANFIEQMGRRFREDYDVDVVPFICETFDHALTPDGRMQEKFNQELRGSDMVFFLFYTRLGDYTLEEFEVARAQMQQSGEQKPKIYTYFKALSDGETMEDSLQRFVQTLEQAIGHYHESFTSIDTVKLRILLNLRVQELGFLEIQAKDGYCVVGGEKMLPLDHVAEFCNSKTLQQLREELAEVEAKYFQMKPRYHAEKQDDAFYREYSEIASRRQSLLDAIGDLQSAIFQMSLNMSADEVHGEVTPRQKEAYRLFEQGDYEGALAILDAGEIDDAFEADMRRMEQMQQARVQTYIKEHKTAIDILMAMYDDRGRFAEIESRYEKIVPVAKKYGVRLGVVYDYISYLYNQHQYEKAIRLAEELQKNETYCAKEDDRLKLLNQLAILYSDTNHFAEAEALWLEALELHRALAEKNSDAYNPAVAGTCNNLALLYKKTNRFDEAEAFYLEALELRRALAEKNPDAYNPDVARTCDNLANLYSDTNRMDEAEALYLEALKLCRALAEKHPDVYNPDAARTCNNLAALYYKTNRMDEAEALCLEALELRRALAEKNPDAYNPDVAMTCNNLANLYSDTNRMDEAEALYLEALKLCRALAEKNPNAYNPYVARTCNSLAALYDDINRKDEAEALYLEALEIYRALAEKNPNAYNPDVAMTCNNLAVLYDDINRKDEAEALWLEALEIYRALAEKNPDAYNPNVATTCNNLANLYSDTNRMDEAEALYLEALELYRTLAEKHPDAYNPDVAMTCNNLANLYSDTNRMDEAEALYLEALELRRALAEKNPDAYNPDVATTCFNLANFCKKNNRQSEADALYAEALELAKRYPQNAICAEIIKRLS